MRQDFDKINELNALIVSLNIEKVSLAKKIAELEKDNADLIQFGKELLKKLKKSSGSISDKSFRKEMERTMSELLQERHRRV